jgi:hypothetical protein
MLSWDDIKERNLSWKYLRSTLEFTPEELQRVQPDKLEWICSQRITIADCKDAMILKINPLTDMLCDLGEMWKLMSRDGVSVEDLSNMGVNFTQMKHRGLTPEIMFYFDLPITDWMILGMQVEDLTIEHTRVFQLPLDEIKYIVNVGLGRG